MYKTTAAKHEEDSLYLRCGRVQKHDVESAVNSKLVQGEVQEEDRAVVLQCNSSGQRQNDTKIIVTTDSETITIPKYDKHCNIWCGNVKYNILYKRVSL
jgi:hypothetical protein